jgi:CHAT domain-containing protein
MKRKIRSLLNSLLYSIWLGLLTFFLVTAVLPVAAQQLTIIQNSNAPSQLEQGLAFYEVGRFSEAVTQWQQAVRDFEARGDRINQAVSLNYLSQAYQDLGQWQDAQKAISQSLELLTTNQQQTTNNKLIFAQALNTKGSLQLAMGQTEAALDTWKQAENAYAEAGDETGVLGSRINQAQALQTLGLYRRAQTTLEQVNETLQTKPDSLLKATGLRSLGVALQVVGDLQKSQEVLEQSLAIAQRLDSSPDTSATLFSLGNTVKALQDYQNAARLYHEAAEKATTPISKLEAQLNQLSLVLQTKQWEAARTLLPQIQSQLTQVPPSRAAVYAQVNLAESLIKIGNGAGETEQQGNRDVQAPEEQVPGTPGDTNTGILPQNSQRRPVSLSSPRLADSRDVAQLLAAAVQQARMLKDPRAESYALGELGQLYERTQQLSDAQKLTQEALSLAQSISASDIAYRWQWQLGRILKQKDNITGAIAAYSEAVNTLQSLRTDLVAINPDVQFTFRDSVEPIYRELVELLLQPLTNQGEVPSQENLIQARKVIESLQLAELDNFFREACLNAKPELIDQVDPAAAIIYPIILPDRLAVILSLPEQSSDELRLRYYQTKLPDNEVEGILKQLLQSLNPAFSNKQRLRFSQQVYDWLIRPAEAQLAQSGVKTLVFVLDGPLRNLPMAALHDGQQYLVEKYSIALSQGLQLLEPRSLVRQRLKALMGGLTEARQGFSALPAVNSELNQISSEVRSEVLLNQQFTNKSLEKQINQAPFPIIHLATHAQFSSKAEDTFLLTWDGRINVKDFDQLLQARERQNTNPIELFVLSACQTATGDNRATLGLAGLAVRSGARSTLATLWSVRDESTAELMVEFYRQLLQTEVSKAEALRQAQLRLLKQPQYKHPYYWAPFVLVGNWL